MASARLAVERKSALLNEMKGKLDEVQKSSASAASAMQALARAEQQLKEASISSARKDGKIKEVCLRMHVHAAAFCACT